METAPAASLAQPLSQLERQPVQDGKRAGSLGQGIQSLTDADRSCTWPRTRSLRSRQLCRCRTSAPTARSPSLQTVTFYRLSCVVRGPPGAMGRGALRGIKPEWKKAAPCPPSPRRVFLGWRAPAWADTPRATHFGFGVSAPGAWNPQGGSRGGGGGSDSSTPGRRGGPGCRGDGGAGPRSPALGADE